MTYFIMCRADTEDGRQGAYVKAREDAFPDVFEAKRYLSTISPVREPLIIDVDAFYAIHGLGSVYSVGQTIHGLFSDRYPDEMIVAQYTSDNSEVRRRCDLAGPLLLKAARILTGRDKE